MASVLMQIEVVQTFQNMLLVEIGVLRTVNRGRLIRFIGQLPWCSSTDTPTFSNPTTVRHKSIHDLQLEYCWMLHTQAYGELVLSENSSSLASVCVKPLTHLKYLHSHSGLL